MTKLPAVFALVLAFGQVAAQNVELVEQRYSTELSTTVKTATFGPGGMVQQTTTQSSSVTGPSPLTETLQGSTHTFATATANPVSVSTYTDAHFDLNRNEVSTLSRAVAETVLSFSALANSNADMLFSFAGTNQAAHSDGFISLVDRTFSSTVFSYSWGFGLQGTVPWSTITQTGVLDLSPNLIGSHLYDLTLHASTNANTDEQGISIALSRFSPFAAAVPEPETYAMVLVGLAVVGLARRIRRRK